MLNAGTYECKYQLEDLANLVQLVTVTG